MITPRMLDEFRADFERQMEALQDKYGIAIELGTIRYGSDHFQVTMKGATRDNPGEGINEITYKKYAREHDLDVNAVGYDIRLNGKSYTFMGMEPGNKKNNCIIKSNRGTLYACPVESIIEYLR